MPYQARPSSYMLQKLSLNLEHRHRQSCCWCSQESIQDMWNRTSHRSRHYSHGCTAPGSSWVARCRFGQSTRAWDNFDSMGEHSQFATTAVAVLEAYTTAVRSQQQLSSLPAQDSNMSHTDTFYMTHATPPSTSTRLHQMPAPPPPTFLQEYSVILITKEAFLLSLKTMHGPFFLTL